MKLIKRPSALFTSLSCAAIAAQFFYVAANAAVPIEESVEESARSEVEQVQRQVDVRPRARSRSLAIPQTIEPTINTDYPSQRAGSAVGQQAAAAPDVGGNAWTGNNNRAASSNGAAGAGQLSELFYQIQVLQQEIQDLRGQVEEQSYLVNRLQRDQKEQYLDLDRRVVALAANKPTPGPSSTSTQPRPAPAQSGSNLTEREAYTAAFEAMRAREFDTSMVGFQDLIESYPNGQYTPNAYYWIGELNLVAKADPEAARQSFIQVVSLYPDHNKAADAMYKLGVVYHNLGDIDAARTYLQRVQQEHANSPAAGLAAKYAAELP